MKQSKKHIVLICSRLDLPGGTERGIINTANLLCTDAFNISLLVLDVPAEPFYTLHPDVKCLYVPLHFGIINVGNVLTKKFAFLNHIKRLRQILAKMQADVVIGTEYVFAIAAKLASFKMSVKIFSWEHHHYYWLQKSAFWRFLLQKVYPKLNGVICLNTTEAAIYKRLGCKTIIIPYYVNRADKQATLNSKTIVTIGWLIKRKGVELIPQVAEFIFKNHPDWQWQIIGKGEEYGLLKKLIEEKNLDTKIQILPPVTNDLTDVYLNTSIYVMLSRFEALPFVLLESMSFGVPCVAFDCPSGPSDIINDDITGFLIEQDNIALMSNAIITLMEEDTLRMQMGENAYNNILQFSSTTVLSLWQQVLNAE